MNILEYNPMNVLNEVDKIFSSLFSLDEKRYSLTPAVELKELKDKYVLKAELPGVDKKDLNIEIDENNILTISGKKEEEKMKAIITQKEVTENLKEVFN